MQPGPELCKMEEGVLYREPGSAMDCGYDADSHEDTGITVAPDPWQIAAIASAEQSLEEEEEAEPWVQGGLQTVSDAPENETSQFASYGKLLRSQNANALRSKNDSAKRSLDVAATVDLQPPQTTTLAHPPAMGSTSPQQADLRLDAQALSTPFLPEEYTSPLAEPENAIYATTLHSNPVENDRNSHKNQQVMGPAANKIGNSGAMAMCGGTLTGNVARPSGLMDTLSALSPKAASVLEYLSHTMGLGGAGADGMGTQSQGSTGADKRRTLRVALSMHDPTICSTLVRAHQMFVCGESLKALRAAGINIGHLIRIGVTFEEWVRCGYSARDVGFMEGQWHNLAQMGFTPKHMVSKRENSGPAVISAHPFNATFNDLERDIGLTIDESVFECELSTADFSILGETVGTLRRRGFHSAHAQHMKEPPYNYTMSLDATEHDILFLFPESASDAASGNRQLPAKPGSRSRNLVELHRNQSEPSTNSASCKPRQFKFE